MTTIGSRDAVLCARGLLRPRAMSDDEKKPSVPSDSNGQNPPNKELVRLAAEDKPAPVNVNVLVMQVVQQAPAAERMELTERVLERVLDFESKMTDLWIKRSNQSIDFKTRDPDEVEKRRNNRVRRVMKYGILLKSLGCLGGGMYLISVNASINVTSALLFIGAMGLGITAALTGNESISTNDIIRMMNELKGFLPRFGTQEPTSNRRNKKGGGQ